MSPFVWKFTVPVEAIDSQGHVNNVAYVQWMQDVAIKHTNSVGGNVVAAENGIIWVVRSHEIEYLRQVFVGEELRAETFIEDTQRATSVRRYTFTRVSDEKVVARGRTNWVCLDKTSGRPRAIPEDVLKAYDQPNSMPKGQLLD